ncbi:hypothetical protein SAMN05216353_110115 [Halobacillus alkaliphilus]|uniref:Transcriptional regulator, TetR family n=1 Tax=Halobacillus alkaliphilus TaxID=396056 RepID=A0A1I2LXM7_9BACI|nr:hypothetical protein [Halobacillus alkaliphilus]SFF84015.1 hypothetical protein SAMN05216353_110115 [Halobacillus alkaliphilus]
MKQKVSHEDMDQTLRQLEKDYIEALDRNQSTSVEDFIDQFLKDSWEYNHQNMENIKLVMKRYSQGDIYSSKFSGAFIEMVAHLQEKLASLDGDNHYPLVHSQLGASVLVAIVDGLVVQLYTGMYQVEDLQDYSSQFKQVILRALSTPTV